MTIALGKILFAIVNGQVYFIPERLRVMTMNSGESCPEVADSEASGLAGYYWNTRHLGI